MITINEQGKITTLQLNQTNISFRTDEYGGPALFVKVSNPDANVTPIQLKQTGEQKYVGEYETVQFAMTYHQVANGIELDIAIHNQGGTDFNPDAVELRLGIDTYMASYPEWNDKFFCTMNRCEKTHMWGYMKTPNGKVLVIASKDPVASWHHNYNRADYGGRTTDTGHRIYTTSLDLLNKGDLPERHPQHLDQVKAGETKQFRILLALVESEADIQPTVVQYTGADFIQINKYTFELGEEAKVTNKGTLHITSPSGQSYNSLEGVQLNEYGTWKITTTYMDKVSEALIYVRKPWSYYLQEARKAALRYEQKAATHTESWYGFFSAFLARKYYPNPELDAQLEEKFEEVYQVMHHEDTGLPVDAAIPGRIQNSALMISALVDLYEVTKEEKYLDRAVRLAELIMNRQSEDGAYRCGGGVHYTCVIYIAKALMELYAVEVGLSDTKWQEIAQVHYESITRAINELRDSRDDIQTEGEMTFEDGMISCSSLQLGMFALMQKDAVLKKGYIEAAQYMLEKHACLELNQIPDCRMRGATLRFWETMYDVMIPQNMMTSPHGWTSWKTYATYYLYRLTGEKKYLKATMDTLGASVQVIDIHTGDLRWAFVTDPYVEADVFVKDEENVGCGKLVRQVVGEQYIDMVSEWWHTDPTIVSYGYAHADRDQVDGLFKGGACDNDVHEHFKCLEEVALTKAYVHQDTEEVLVYNCTVKIEDNHIEITLAEDVIDEVVIYVEKPCTIQVLGWKNTFEVQPGINKLNK